MQTSNFDALKKKLYFLFIINPSTLNIFKLILKVSSNHFLSFSIYNILQNFIGKMQQINAEYPFCSIKIINTLMS